MHVASEEGCNVWPSLGDDEVIHIEKLRDTEKWGITFRGVFGLRPGPRRRILSR